MKYRVYYAEREVGRGAHDVDGEPPIMLRSGTTHFGSPLVRETEWEDEVDASSIDAALDQFFREHAGSPENVKWLDDDDMSHAAAGLSYDPDRSYIWIEEDRLMAFQGIDPAEPGQTVCPFCSGKGTVDESVAQEYFEDQEDDGMQAEIRG